MTKVTYDIVEHDGGWVYRGWGVSPRPSLPTTWPAKRRSAQRRNKSSQERRRAFRTKTRKGVGTTNYHRAMTGPRPMSRVEREQAACPTPHEATCREIRST